MQLPQGTEELHARRYEADSYPLRIPGFSIGEMVEPGDYDINDGDVMTAIPSDCSMLVAVSITPTDNKQTRTGYLGNFDLYQPDESSEKFNEMIEDIRDDSESYKRSEATVQAWLGGASLKLETSLWKKFKEEISVRPAEIARMRKDTADTMIDNLPMLDSIQQDWLAIRERVTMISFDPAMNQVRYKVAKLN